MLTDEENPNSDDNRTVSPRSIRTVSPILNAESASNSSALPPTPPLISATLETPNPNPNPNPNLNMFIESSSSYNSTFIPPVNNLNLLGVLSVSYARNACTTTCRDTRVTRCKS